MRNFFGSVSVVFLLFSSVFVTKHVAADGFAASKHIVNKIVTKSKTVQWGKKLMGAAVVVAACANLLSCGEWQREVYDVIDSSELEGLPIMQGATTADQTQIFILTPQSDNYAYSLLDGGGNVIRPAAIDTRGRQGSEHVIQHVSFRGLLPNSHYLLQVHAAEGELLDERELQTLDPSRQEVRFAFGSCMADYEPQKDIWQQMVALHPDVIFLIGDNVYTNGLGYIAHPDFMWRRYHTTRSSLLLFRSRQLIPVVAVWDDHDYGMSNGDHTYPYKEEALSIFKTFFASNDNENFYMPNFGAASFFNIYGYNFFLLDDRTFRTPKSSSPEWHFGKAQSSWLLDNLAGKDHAFILSGDQFFGGYIPKDSFQGNHPERFGEFLADLKDTDTKVVFLSGDRHFTEIMKVPTELLGYQTYEFTSSPMHSSYRTVPRNNPLRLTGQSSSRNNFMLIEASKSDSRHALAGDLLQL